MQRQRHGTLLMDMCRQQQHRDTSPPRARSNWQWIHWNQWPQWIHRSWVNHACTLFICGQASAPRAFFQYRSMVASARCRHCPARRSWRQWLYGSRGVQRLVPRTTSACLAPWRQPVAVERHQPRGLPSRCHAPSTLQKLWQRSTDTNWSWTRRRSSGRDWVWRMIRMSCRRWCGTGSTSWRYASCTYFNSRLYAKHQKCESSGANRHTTRYTSPVSVVSQCKLVSGWGLRKRRSMPPYGLGKNFTFLM